MFTNKDKNSPATVGDLEELAGMVVNNFATKEDLKQELSNYPTKDDLAKELSRFATKDDLRDFATKEDFRRLGDNLRGELIEIKNEILNSNDIVVKKLDSFMTEKVVLGGQVKEQWEEVDKLKKRVSVVEKHIGIEPVLVTH